MNKSLTWTHVVNATSAKFIAEPVGCSEAEVGDGDLKTVVEAENVLWLQISVKNTESGSIQLHRAARGKRP